MLTSRFALPLLASALLVASVPSCSSGEDGGSGHGGAVPAGGSGGVGASGTAGSGATTTGGSGAGTTSSGASGGEGGGPNTGGTGAGAGPAEEPCPALAAPASCFDREVMYREWSAAATGDGTYFADQAPGRLGFTRVQGRIWIVKFQTEENSYFGSVDAAGNSSGGFAWISRDTCDATFAIQTELVTWSGSGGGNLSFVVVRDEADEALLDGDPTLAAWATMPRLRGGYCYYVAFENSAGVPDFPLQASAIETSGDDCGANGDGTCYYLAIDFNHRLHDITTNQLIAGNVIAGLTH